MEDIKKILVVNRMSQYCHEAVQAGISLAKKFGASLEVLHLVSNPVDQEALNAPLPYPDERYKSYLSIQQEARERLDKLLRREMESGFLVKIIVKEGEPAEEVVNVVKEEKIDLIVMLAQEEGRLEHILFGRDTDAIIRRIPCNMLLVKREPESVKW